MGWLRADLHNHSCLSPCGSLDMSPRAMAARAVELGIHILALTDHNSALNCPAFDAACREAGILGIFGLEITTQEELHVLALFETPEKALEMGNWVEHHYQGFPNNPDKMGDQVYLDKDENILGEVEINLAQGAVQCSLEQIGEKIHKYKGLFIPAHIDRPSFSLISQLGFIPQGAYDGLERIGNISSVPPGIPLLTGSDAHYLEDMGKRTFQINCLHKDFQSVIEALHSGNLK